MAQMRCGLAACLIVFSLLQLGLPMGANAAVSFSPANGGPQGFIRVQGTKFVDENCNDFTFVGANVWDLLENTLGAVQIGNNNGNPTYYAAGQTPLEWLMDTAVANDLKVIRVFAHGYFTKAVLQPQLGVYNETVFKALDKIVYQASIRNVRLLFTFSGNWQVTDGRAQYAEWGLKGSEPEEAYTNPISRAAFKNHITTMVTRVNTISGIAYGNDPTIFAWDLMNEPRGDCEMTAQNASCTVTTTIKIQNWIDEMAAHFKSVNKNQLLTVGEEGYYGWGASDAEMSKNPAFDWPQRSGQNVTANHASKDIDFIAFHTWPDNWNIYQNQVTALQFEEQWIQAHIDTAIQLGKPLVHEEFGKNLYNPISQRSAEVESSRNPYLALNFKAFKDALAVDSPLRGIAFWSLDYLQNDFNTETYAIYVYDTTFTTIIAPGALAIYNRPLAKVAGCTAGALTPVAAINKTTTAAAALPVAAAPAPAAAAAKKAAPVSASAPAPSASLNTTAAAANATAAAAATFTVVGAGAPATAAAAAGRVTASSDGTCSIEGTVQYAGTVLTSVSSVDSADRCCSLCSRLAGCNIFVYCGETGGCTGAPSVFQQCDLKTQALTVGANPEVITRAAAQTSGSIAKVATSG